MRSNHHPSAGFTLLEVLVATAVLAIMMVILLGSVTTSLSIWRNTENQIAADREGRSAFQVMADDLANAIVPSNQALWPKTTNDAEGAVLRFLTSKPADYQSSANDVGDVCYVEYRARTFAATNKSNNNVLLRRFLGSEDTYKELKIGQLPQVSTDLSDFQLLATNIITNGVVLKGLAIMRSANSADINGIRTNFTLLSFTNNAYTNAGVNRPDAIQVSIGAVDMDTMRNPTLLSNVNIPLKGGGYYTFTVNLPPAQ